MHDLPQGHVLTARVFTGVIRGVSEDGHGFQQESRSLACLRHFPLSKVLRLLDDTVRAEGAWEFHAARVALMSVLGTSSLGNAVYMRTALAPVS